MGYSPTLIRALGGGATQFTINAGDPLLSASQVDVGAFVGDDWCVRSNLTQNGSRVGGPNLRATQATATIKLDGQLDEEAWRPADMTAELVQQSPNPGTPTPYKTTVRVLVTRDSLYFGFDCADPDPSRMATHTMDRDGKLEGDDTLAIVIDGYGDRRTGYYFRINSAGARVDGLVSGVDQPSLDWNGIWDAAMARSGAGWSAEIVIPARTLSFTRGLSKWGVNFERTIARDRTVLRWASPALDSIFYDLSRAGNLENVESLQQGLGIEVSPYVTGRMKDLLQTTGRNWFGKFGGDATYRITPQMAAVFAVNTDLAETEVDSRKLNIRLRWTIKPGNDLFIVWNRAWERTILTRDDLSLVPDSELLAVKFRWTFRK